MHEACQLCTQTSRSSTAERQVQSNKRALKADDYLTQNLHAAVWRKAGMRLPQSAGNPMGEENPQRQTHHGDRYFASTIMAPQWHATVAKGSKKIDASSRPVSRAYLGCSSSSKI
jgi:hypothetical protein